MKRCLQCGAVSVSFSGACPNCETSANFVDGFEAFAPQFAHDGGGFKDSYFAELSRLEDKSFWFQSRNRLILWALRTYFPDFRSFLEVGCGTGHVLAGIFNSFPRATLCGSEIFTAGLGDSASRLPSVKLMQMDARNIPFVDEFDVIGAFDVLEHIEEDELVLKQMAVALKSNGCILLIVPQHAWLWSATDEYACHVRRYAKNDLHQKVKAAGFQVIRSTSFVATLLPAMIISRLFQKKVSDQDFDPTAELRISPLLNSLFAQFLGLELARMRRGIDFPVGGSRFVIAKKTSRDA